MNLTKSFNFKFFKQNVKKSRGGIILSIIILPLILSIMMFLTGTNYHNVEIISSDSYGVINLVLMYIIPFVYSVYLFGYVFKKPSTDFLNSLPINRKTVFVTNTIGGIGLITIIQALATMTVFAWSFIFKNIVIFPAEIFEMALLCWTSYVFIFVASNLAMTFSGTKSTQFVVTVLILFIVPVCAEFCSFLIAENNSSFSNYDLSIVKDGKVSYFYTLENIKNYTMPFKFIRYGLQFSWQTIIRMLILSVVYYYLGLKIYQKRKMEDNEESFGSEKLHVIVKALTLVPMLLFINMSDEITTFVIAIIFMAVYYVIFDLIVKRKIPFIRAMSYFIISVVVIQVSVSLVKSIGKDTHVNVDYGDVKEISLGYNTNSLRRRFLIYYSYETETDMILDGNYFIDDKSLLDLVLENTTDSKYNPNQEYHNIEILVNIRLKSGKQYSIETYVTRACYEKIIEKLKNNEEYMNHIKKDILNKDGIYMINDKALDSKAKKIVKEEIKENIENLDVYDVERDSVYYIKKTFYKNHSLVTYKIPINLSNNLLEVISEILNKEAKEIIENDYYGIDYINVFDEDGSVGSVYNLNGYMEDFLEDHINDDFDPNEEYYIISGFVNTSMGSKTMTFFTNEVDEVYDIVNKNKNPYYYD